MSLYLGIDLGTQGVKVLVFDADARRVVARAGRALPALASPRPGVLAKSAGWALSVTGSDMRPARHTLISNNIKE